MYAERITLTSKSELIETYWHYDEVTEIGSYLKRQIFMPTIGMLHSSGFEFEDGATFKNLVEFMTPNIDIWDALIGNWCKEIVTEAANKPVEPLNIEYICISQNIETSVGIEDKQACYRGLPLDISGKSADNEINTSLSFIPANDLIHLPIKIDYQVRINHTNYDTHEYTTTELGTCMPTMFEVVYSIFWELSFHGSPEKRDKEHQDLLDAIKEVRSSNPDWFEEN